jgi:predicted ATPase
MGAGKSTVLNGLRASGLKCIDEPARIVLKDQRASGGTGVPDKDPGLFNSLMLNKMMFDFKENADENSPVLFDRGIPDVIAYAQLLNTDRGEAIKASETFKYNTSVFMFSAWKDIYANDEERMMSFELASEFGENVRRVYENAGYEIIDVPFVSVMERVEFIKKCIRGK